MATARATARAERTPGIGAYPGIARGQYSELVPNLRFALLDFQRQLREASVPVVVLVAGADGVKSETVNCLHGWLDARGLETHIFGPADTVGLDRPLYARYATSLPARGRIGLYFGSWYTRVAAGRMAGTMKKRDFAAELDRIAAFEQALVADGYLVLKIWLDLSRGEQEQRLKKLARDRRTSWRVSRGDWDNLAHFGRTRTILRAFQERTGEGAPWHVVPAADDRHRNVSVARLFVDAAAERLAVAPAGRAQAPAPIVQRASRRPLQEVDLRRTAEAEQYESQLEALQRKLTALTRKASKQRRPAALVFEGWDAAGKGGAIRRIIEPLDARYFRVVPIAAPTEEERDHHYLWRFWRHVPTDGQMTIFDRSWYGRVLVERVEGFATEAEWGRAFDEINEFESHLVGHGTMLAKFWLHLSPEEQLRRFREREVTPYKRHKITEEDWRNREKWEAYEGAVNEMITRTSNPPGAPWMLIPAEDKRLARLLVLRAVCERLEAAIGS
jgi:polyphosphate:AMP phosphotransferase